MLKELASVVWGKLAIVPRLLPKPKSNRERVDLDLIPPRSLVGVAMELAVMDPTNRDRELVANSTAQRPRLRKPEMMGIRGRTPAYEARLPGHEFQVVLVAHANRFPERLDCAGALGFAR